MTHAASELWQYRGLIGNFAQRELKGKYRGSTLGWAWSLLNPLATLGIYTLVFGFFIRFPVPVAGNGHLRNFAVYLFTALVVWNFFFTVTTGSMAALIGAGPLLRKIYFPPYVPVAGSAIAVVTQTGIELGLLLAVYLAVGNISWTIVLLPVLLVLLAAFSLGVGLVLAILNARFRDVSYLVSVGFNLLFYATPIVYPISFVTKKYDEHPWLRLYEYNPVTAFVEAFRDVLYDLRLPPASRLGYLAVVSAAVLVLGWTYFRRSSADISEEL
jgi:ABC-type polysaccharide/polyol phosphate export permease